MTWFYRTLVRPALFSQDSEVIHNRTLARLAWLSRREIFCEAIASFLQAPRLPVNTLGLTFPNPVGLAAGLDKLAEAVPAWAALGFGFSELGGVTWHAQPGNPPPRVFRAVAEGGLVNRMGFNNPGAEAVAKELAAWRAAGRWPARHPVGINLGKSKVTPLPQAAEDYAQSLRVLWPYADFFVVNVSSPNTPGLRQLQDRAALNEILAALQEVNRAMQTATPLSGGLAASGAKPLLVKVAPDLSLAALDQILELVGPRQVAGLVATNTTISRPATEDPDLRKVYAEAGGLSGRPLRARSTELIRHLYRQTRGVPPIIGVGGIFSAADAWEKITAGAVLVQLYTGLVFEGPAVVREIVSGLRARLAEAGFARLEQAVGTAA
ncbi:MAG: quinone-dependent dihydroorotate dehydrogenase [Verrucomicrobia bacterium]|nr:quinone-dependent dihydroorotate dehydrogenase [Verrucomicrobiota bacterium]